MTTEDESVYEIYHNITGRYTIYMHRKILCCYHEFAVKEGFTNKENAIRYLRNILKIKTKFYLSSRANIEHIRNLIIKKLDKLNNVILFKD